MNSTDVALPDDVRPYKRTALFTEATVPQGLLNDHSTKQGVWGVIHVTKGRLRYIVPDRELNAILDPNQIGIIQPAELHRVEPVGSVAFFVEFHRRSDGSTSG